MRKYPAYHVYREGDYCPVKLSWCTWMSQKEYESACRNPLCYPLMLEYLKNSPWGRKQGAEKYKQPVLKRLHVPKFLTKVQEKKDIL